MERRSRTATRPKKSQRRGVACPKKNRRRTVASPKKNRQRTVASPKRNRRRRKRARQVSRLRRQLIVGLLILMVLFAHSAFQGSDDQSASEPSQAVKLILQNPELPNGCEVTSMAMALGAAGYPVDKLTLYGYLPRKPITNRGGQSFGPNPEEAYAGDAAKLVGGWYCFEGPVIQAADRWLENNGSDLCAQSVTGLSRAKLDRYAQSGVPLVVWVTLNYAAPQYSGASWTLEDGTAYRPYRNLHCVVLAGMEEGQYRIADPLAGFTQVDKELFWNSFFAMGCRAVVIG